jgi:hypothetical protein
LCNHSCSSYDCVHQLRIKEQRTNPRTPIEPAQILFLSLPKQQKKPATITIKPIKSAHHHTAIYLLRLSLPRLPHISAHGMHLYVSLSPAVRLSQAPLIRLA